MPLPNTDYPFDRPHGANRACKECQLCCEVLDVEGTTKAGELCKHQCAKGCAIYASRPKTCKDYECLWLRGLFGNKDRPDTLGVFFSPAHHKQLGALLIAYERKEGAAFNNERALGIINRFALRMVVLVVPPSLATRKLVCHNPAILKRAKAAFIEGDRTITML